MLTKAVNNLLTTHVSQSRAKRRAEVNVVAGDKQRVVLLCAEPCAPPAISDDISGCTVHHVEIMTGAGPARAEVRRRGGEPRFLVVLTHGAGGTPDTADVLAARDAALALGGATALVTQPYRVRGARAPGSAARQDAAWVEIVAALNTAGLPLVQGGRSNGARVACRTARQLNAVGVIALAFPLHPPGHKGEPGKSRDGELRDAGARVLVVNGERDPFGIPEPDDATRVVVLPGETHALSRKPAAIGEAVTGWLGTLPGLGQAAGT